MTAENFPTGSGNFLLLDSQRLITAERPVAWRQLACDSLGIAQYLLAVKSDTANIIYVVITCYPQN